MCLKKANQASCRKVTNCTWPPWPSLHSWGKNTSPWPSCRSWAKTQSSSALSGECPDAVGRSPCPDSPASPQAGPEEKRLLPTVRLQMEAREEPQETPQGYMTNSGQCWAASSTSIDTKWLQAGRAASVPPCLLTACYWIPALSSFQNQPLLPSPGGTTRWAPPHPQQVGHKPLCTTLTKSSSRVQMDIYFCRSHKDSQPNIYTSYFFLLQVSQRPLELSRNTESWEKKQMGERS